jgi:hypothetical protein
MSADEDVLAKTTLLVRPAYARIRRKSPFSLHIHEASKSYGGKMSFSRNAQSGATIRWPRSRAIDQVGNSINPVADVGKNYRLSSDSGQDGLLPQVWLSIDMD